MASSDLTRIKRCKQALAHLKLAAIVMEDDPELAPILDQMRDCYRKVQKAAGSGGG